MGVLCRKIMKRAREVFVFFFLYLGVVGECGSDVEGALGGGCRVVEESDVGRDGGGEELGAEA